MNALDVASELYNTVHEHGLHGIELEFRLGHVVGDTFLSKVTEASFKKIEAYIQSLDTVDRTIRIHTSEKIHNQVKHITTLSLEEHGETKPPPPLSCMQKIRAYTGNFAVKGSPYTIRCAISREQVVTNSPPPPPNEVCLVREKIRTRYISGCWAYDLTQVTSNTDEETVHEVELELIDPEILFHTPMDVVAQDALFKMHQLLKHVE